MPAEVYLRYTSPDKQGNRFAKAVWQTKNRLRPHYAMVDGKPQHHPNGVYYLRFRLSGKRVWEPVGTEPELVPDRLKEKNHYLSAIAIGKEPAPESQPGQPGPKAVTAPEPEPGRLETSKAIEGYLAETKDHKSQKTFAAYRKTLKSFAESCNRQYLDAITREDLLNFITHLKSKGNAPRTLRNRIDFLQIFFHHFGLPSLLKGKDLPKSTEKKVRKYPKADLEKLFAAADQEETNLMQFFLCTGFREQEVEYACWTDLDFGARTITVTEKLDLGFRPKDKEEGTIPIPSSLVEILKARKERVPSTRLIFPTADNKPDGHMLRIIKRLALESGVNCGHCINKKGASCADRPVCRHIGLHRFRKTFASMHHHNGMPARTLMRLLRHSDLETTLAYLSDQEDNETRFVVEGTFAGLGIVSKQAAA